MSKANQRLLDALDKAIARTTHDFHDSGYCVRCGQSDTTFSQHPFTCFGSDRIVGISHRRRAIDSGPDLPGNSAA